jgi:hypothetical protein
MTPNQPRKTFVNGKIPIKFQNVFQDGSFAKTALHMLFPAHKNHANVRAQIHILENLRSATLRAPDDRDQLLQLIATSRSD